MLNAAAIKAYLYAKNNGKKPIISLKKEGEKLFLIGMCTVLALTAWFYIPALSSVLLYFLVPLTFYFLYNTYNFSKNCLHKLLNKDNKTHDENREAVNVIAMDQPSQAVRIIESQKQIESLPGNIPEFVLESLKKLAVQNPQKAFDLAICVKQTELIINGLEQTIKDKFYKSLMDLILVDHQKAYNSAVWICKVDELFNKISKPIRDRFYEYVMNLTLTNHEKAYSLATWIRDNDALLNRVKQCTKPKSYEYVMNLTLTNREKANTLATLIDEVNDLFNEIRPPIRDKFFNPIIQLAYTDRDDALVLANTVKEIDDIVSGITNKKLLDYFDQFFTSIETQHVHERVKLIAFARECKRINKVMPIGLQEISSVQAKLRPEGILLGGIIKSTEVASYLEMASSIGSSCVEAASSYAEAVSSTVKSLFSCISDISQCIQGGNYCGH